MLRFTLCDDEEKQQSIRRRFVFPFGAVAPLLAGQRFCLCGASYVLNFQYVTGMKGQSALLDNGQVVVLPRTSSTEFKKAWGNYWLGEKNA